MRQNLELLISEFEVSKILGIKQRTLQQWRATGRGPSFVRLPPRIVRYRISEIDSWIKAHQGSIESVN